MASARGALRIIGAEPAAAAVLWLVLATSGVVLVEPAPHDGLMVLTVVAAALVGIKVPRRVAPMAVLLAVIVAFDAIGSAQAPDIGEALTHSLVSLYLAGMAVFIACVAAWRPATSLPLMFSALTVAALVACIAAIVGYFALVPGAAEMFTLFDRAKGTFKDPNVFGPFLVLPVLFGVERVLARGLVRGWYWPAILAVLIAGLFLSFSRGAWANLVISLAVFLAILLGRNREPAVHRRAVLLIVVGGAVTVLAIAYALSFHAIGDLFAQRAALEQGYDVSAEGRFAGQIIALKVIATEPLGIGSTAFARYHPEQPHDVYLNVFLNAGWVGGFAYLTLIGVTLARGLGVALRGRVPVGAVAVVFAAFLGTVVEGLIVDTDHWRSFFVELGMLWGVIAIAAPAPLPAMAARRELAPRPA